MKRINLDRDWLFSAAAPQPGRPSPEGRTVHLPHDFTIESDVSPSAPSGHATGYYGGGVGVYTKQLDIPADWEGRRVLVEFDGAYMNAVVELNGHTAGLHHYGYTPFHVDLTRFVRPGRANRLTVTVNNTAQLNSRWYSGSGLYRHVDLLVAPETHIAPWGVFARTERVEGDIAFVLVEITVENHAGAPATRRVRCLIDQDGGPLAGGETQIRVLPGSASVARLRLAVKGAKLWDVDDPRLCRVSAELLNGGVQEDYDCVSFGIRTISVDTQNGFRLNGRSLKLRGGCIHHDNGILGAASYYDSEYRKLKLHKDNGFNAVRCAHNPPSRDMLDACDRLGILVIDEAFDCWRMGKNLNDYNLYFESDWEADMTAFITRDRNHPSVAIWSTGNEIVERGGLSDGYAWAERLAATARRLDPGRPVLNALCSMWSGLDDEDAALANAGAQNDWDAAADRLWTGLTEPFCAPLDIVGYNYLNQRYARDGEIFPTRVICGTESFPMEIDRVWRDVKRLPWVIGDFTWTSYDYIGEAAIGRAKYVDPAVELKPEETTWLGSEFPWRLANDADFDLIGFGRPQLAYRRIVWGSEETYIACQSPAVFARRELVSRWGWPWRENVWTWDGSEGRPIRVDVYSAAEEVELFVNGVSLGRKPAGEARRFTASFEAVYAPGTVEAVSYTAGREVSRQKLVTAGVPFRLAAAVENAELAADGKSLSFVTFEIQDAAGNRVPHTDLMVRAAVEGPGALAALGSARAATTENYTSGAFTTCDGRVQAIVRSGCEAGVIRLVAEAEGLPACAVEIQVGK